MSPKLLAISSICSLFLVGCASTSNEVDPRDLMLQELTQRVANIEQQQNDLQTQLAVLSQYSHIPKGVAAVPVARNTGMVINEQVAQSGDGGIYEQALNIYRAGDIVTAIPMFERYLAENPNGAQVPMAQYWLGDAYYNQRDYQMANRYLGTFLKNMPNSDKTQVALSKLIESLRAVGRNEDADILSQSGVSAIVR